MKDVIKTQQRPEEIKIMYGQRVRTNRRQRRSNMKGYYALALMFVALIVLFLCLTVFFRTSDIKIEGVTLYRDEQIIGVSGISKGANLMRMDTDTAKQRLLDNLVYLDDVTVTKKYPSTVVISCKEAQKSAEIKDGDDYYVLSGSGKILEKENGKVSENLPVVTGFELKSKNPGEKLESKDNFKADVLKELLSDINDLGFKNITEIDMKSRSDIKLNYDGRIEIDLGSSVDIEYKLNYFKAVIEKSLTKNYEGVLIYNGADSGISAIPKDKTESSSKTDSSSQSEDSSAVETSADAATADDTQSLTDSQPTYNGNYGANF